MRIGYLGVGAMGLPMSGKLLDAGHELLIFDVRAEAMQPLLERQARRADSPKDLADNCEIVVVSLPTLGIFRNALDGEDGLLAGAAIRTLVNTCTVGGPFVEEVERACAGKDVTLVDAPISGGPAGARAGTLSVMVSGDPATTEALTPVFEAWGKTVVIAGDRPGIAQVMKLTNNIVFATALVATVEAMAMAEKGGVKPEDMLRILNNGTGRSFASMSVFPDFLLAEGANFGAAVDILMKDVDLAIEQGEALGIPMWVCQTARQVFKHGVFRGYGPRDLSEIRAMVLEA